MAILIPTYENILKLKQKPTDGELHLLRFLSKYLDDSFEVFFNPYMNGDRPDIVIVRMGYGVLIIEVKDYNLNNYSLDGSKNWINKQENYPVKCPVKQVNKYKDNLFELHIENLYEMNIKDVRHFGIVACAVYLHNAKQHDIENFFGLPYIKNLKYADFIGRDNLNASYFDALLKKRRLLSNIKSYVFTDELYESFKRFLDPPMHMKEEGIYIEYTPHQHELVYESKRKQQRIQGVMGSGKTTVLAGRAVQAHKRTGGNVLILTYNITLKNYIHDKINQVREEFPWHVFTIFNYHQFITNELNNLGIPIEIPKDFEEYAPKQKSDYFEEHYYSNKALFDIKKSKIIPYDVVLIDEIQDYKRAWMDIIKDYFLADGGEYILFGDIKQNIYDNSEIQNKDVVTNVVGRPIELKTCFRSNSKIKELALEFQKSVFKDKYDIDSFTDENDKFLLEKFLNREKEGTVNYEYFPTENNEACLYNIIHKYAIDNKIHPNDITVLGDSIKLLKQFESYYRYLSNERTATMFETSEIAYISAFDNFNKLLSRIEINNNGQTLSRFTMQDAIKAHPANNQEKYKHYLMKYIETANPHNNFNWFIEVNKLIKGKDKSVINRNLDKLFTLYNLYKLYPKKFANKLSIYCEKNNTSLDKFLSFINTYTKEINAFEKDLEEQQEYEKIRTNKKIHFYMNSGLIKISTTHSFKGWECEWVFLVINKSSSNDELIYTGITRCRSNLIIVNFGNEDYDIKLKRIIEKNKINSLA